MGEIMNNQKRCVLFLSFLMLFSTIDLYSIKKSSDSIEETEDTFYQKCKKFCQSDTGQAVILGTVLVGAFCLAAYIEAKNHKPYGFKTSKGEPKSPLDKILDEMKKAEEKVKQQEELAKQQEELELKKAMTPPTVTFDDIGGYEGVKVELRDCVHMFNSTAKYKALGIDKIPHVIFHGPPGTGKTMFASAVAGEARVPFIATSGSDLRAKYYGESTERVGEIFKKARDLSVESGKKVVLFIDEIDSIGQSRNSVTGNSSQDYRASLNKLLTEVDGSQQKTNSDDPQGEVFVIGATNSLEILDPALLRPGRFNRQIFMGLPSESDRRIILDKYKQYPLASNVDLDVIAKSTDGFSGAALSNLLLESAFRAARNDQDVISLENVNEALAKYKESKETKSDGSKKSGNPRGSVNFDKLFSKESIGQVKEFLSNLFKNQNNSSDIGDLDFDDIPEDNDVD